MKKISIIVPCYNEEDIIEIFYNELIKTINLLKEQYLYEIIFINDGSKDNTLNVIKKTKLKDDNITVISFSRNFGKEAAIYAGLENCTGDLAVLIDADLQHPPEKILEMVKGIEERI